MNNLGCPTPVLAVCLAAVLAATSIAHGADGEPSRTARPKTATPPLFGFVLPWDDAGAGVTDLSGWLDAPAGRNGHVVARGGHLYAGRKRVRFLGVNLCFGACFPKHADAEKIAARMAKFGVNCVRFHHMDHSPAPRGIFQRDMRTLDPKQLDKLDYLVAQLKKRGIYTNFNLHVSRVYPGLPRWPGMPSFHKGVDNFHPQMIQLQKDYARDLLTHRNPYTKTRYADEPAVALVEINNENGLLHEWLGGKLDEMPAPFAAELARQWNDWLKAKYPPARPKPACTTAEAAKAHSRRRSAGEGPTPAALKTAWGVKAQPLGRELLSNGDFTDGLTGWNVEQHGGAEVLAEIVRGGPAGHPAAHLNVRRLGQAAWHIQFNQTRIAVKLDTAYTLSFRAKADADRRISVNIGQAHQPWDVFWSADLRLAREWRRYEFVFASGVADDNARVNFSNLSKAVGQYGFADVSFRPGGVVGLKEGEAPGRVEMFRRSEFGRRTVAAHRDWIRFLWQTERKYWRGLRDYIKGDLGSKAVVVGTIVGCSTPNLMADLDAIDVHAYWQHPRFPGRPWDAGHWFVRNLSMVNTAGGVLPGLALRRVLGKPLLCTEYNHPAPNTYSSEAPLLLAAFAAMQDWDGVFLFTYAHRLDDWDARRITNFFDIDQHPTKMANLPVAAALFRRGDVTPAEKWVTAVLEPDDEIELLRTKGRPWRLAHAGLLGVPGEASLLHRVALRVGSRPPTVPSVAAPDLAGRKRFASDTGQLVWDLTRPGKGVVTVDSPRSKAVVGFVDGRRFELGGITLAPGATRQDWCTVSLALVEGESFRLTGPARILLVATGYAENTDMGWRNAEKSTVGRDWGKPPSLVEGIPAAVTLPVAVGRVQAWALDERGRRRGRIKVRAADGGTVLELGPQHRTLWYEVQIR